LVLYILLLSILVEIRLLYLATVWLLPPSKVLPNPLPPASGHPSPCHGKGSLRPDWEWAIIVWSRKVDYTGESDPEKRNSPGA
jgi:hypothetical protein